MITDIITRKKNRLMSKLVSVLYPALQRLRYAKFIALYNSFKKLPMRKNKILMFTTSRGRLGGNLLAIKNYIENNGLSYEITAFTSVNMPDLKTVAREMAESRFILVDDYEPMVYTVKLRENQQLVQVWHAMGAFKKFGYSRSTANKSSLTHKNYTKAIVSSKELTGIYAEAFGIDEKKIYPVGVPRTDMLFDEAYKAETIKRLYEKQPLLKNKKVCLFAPTFRGSNVNDGYYPEEFFDAEKFADELPDDWAVIIKYHPFIKNIPAVPDGVKNRVLDFTDERDINDILFITDVLVTDYSSVIFENAIVGNALVLYAPDLNDYTGDRGFYFDYNDYSCGEIVKNKEKLAAAVINADSENEKSAEFKKRFVSLCDGNSCKRFAEEILK